MNFLLRDSRYAIFLVSQLANIYHSQLAEVSLQESLSIDVAMMVLTYHRGTQRIVLVNYLFRRPLIPSDVFKRIVTLNFSDMRNLMCVVFGLLEMSFWVSKKGQLSFSERR